LGIESVKKDIEIIEANTMAEGKMIQDIIEKVRFGSGNFTMRRSPSPKPSAA
jgi:hypothetical protein